ncbi:MAG TPA: molecular chaperone HtpG [Candidatus Copromorpha excrementigallinarum]|uniref:Chaperone protein HtpG n=1 Tax=Candidatus Allocopromorpha excrementigallinarum TaxID=2840742 RepID=A0A9D1HZV0_9FIRM|nr:molecular chaperone HtpG [Candidatus Copromorpha excrementigallinarum]
MAKKQFKAESKRLLDLMINSIYTHKEIFLRELISNASDAIDKLYYHSLTEGDTGVSRDDFSIRIETDKEKRTLTIKDNGMGMTKEELESNLGTIARSGSLDFKQEMEKKEDVDIIGQFGVGFYSAFMVSDKVTVLSRAYGEEKAYIWESSGADGYTVKEGEKEGCGTEITLELKADTEDENYSRFLEEYTIRDLVGKYSDYIRYPIQMMVEKQRIKEGDKDKKPEEREYETYSQLETLNSMVPLWKKNKSEIREEDYNSFYREKFYDFTDPVKVIHTDVEGVVSYTALLFIPGKAPYNYYTKDFEKGLQLYSSGVLIMDKCPDLLPDYFSFVRGLVDSQDLSLNISREMLQHDRQLKAIAQRLEKKIKSELVSMLNTDRDRYKEFFENFGLQIKYGMYEGFGANRDKLKDLVMFYSSEEKDLVTLSEYVSRMKEEQKYIYYASGESPEKIDKLPQTEVLKDRGYEILYLTDDVDEFALQVLHEFDGKEFKSVSSEDLDIEETAEEKEKAEKQSEESKDMLQYMKEALDGKVADVSLSQRLKTHPVCLTSKGELSIEMEKVLNSMPVDEKIKAERVLEINANHPILKALNKAYAEDKERLKMYAGLLYDQALLIEGLPVEDPVEFSNSICSLITEA